MTGLMADRPGEVNSYGERVTRQNAVPSSALMEIRVGPDGVWSPASNDGPASVPTPAVAFRG